MHKKLSILFAAALTAILAYGAIGSGAYFTASAGASQTLTVGRMTIQLTALTPGSYWDGATLVCPAFKVTTASGPGDTGLPGPACDVKVESTGDISPSQINVDMTATTNGPHLDRYAITPTGMHPGNGPIPGPDGPTFWLSTSAQQIGYMFGNELPATIHLPLDWGLSVGDKDLDNDDQGTTVQAFYTFAAQQ